MRNLLRTLSPVSLLVIAAACGGGSPTAPSATSSAPVATAPAPAPAQPTTMTLGLRFTPVVTASAQDVTPSGGEQRRGFTLNADVTAQNGDVDLSQIRCTGTRGSTSFVIDVWNTPVRLAASHIHTAQKPVTLVTESPLKDTPLVFRCEAQGVDTRGVSIVVNKDETVPANLMLPIALAPCAASSTVACLQNGRFQITVKYQSAPSAPFVDAQVMRLDPASNSVFWFFQDARQLETITQVLNQCGSLNHYSFYGSGPTPFGVEVRVTDTAHGAERKYVNPFNRDFGQIRDTEAFATCP